MFTKKKVTPPEVNLHRVSKVNKSNNVHRCAYCLELSTFRAIQVDGVNKLACIMCLNSVRYLKHKKISEQGITLNRPLKFIEKFRRYKLRLNTYFFGNHIYKSFGRRRTK